MLTSPIRFRPIFQSMLWGGSKLKPFFGQAPSNDPIGEAWLLSDVDGAESVVAGGEYASLTLRQLLKRNAEPILGRAALVNGRFPLLLKLIDAKLPLSVQVHPDDDQAHASQPGQNGKTEAWVVIDADPQTSRMYSGFKVGVTESSFRNAMHTKSIAETLHAFTPKPGDCLFLGAGTVHAIGADTFLFEVQQTSNITYRLYDWDRVDAKTGQPRQLHLEHGLACSNFAAGPCEPVKPTRLGEDELLVNCPYFTLTRMTVAKPRWIMSSGTCRILVCLTGQGTVNGEPFRPGDTLLIPATLNRCEIVPEGRMTVVESQPVAL